MFEAMLYTVLKTLHEQGQWIGSVHAVAPGKIGRFWLGDGDVSDVSGEKPVQDEEEEGPTTTEAGKSKGNGSKKKQAPSNSKSAKTKTAKIRIVQGWLEEVLSSSSSSSSSSNRDSSSRTGASVGNYMEEGRFNIEGSARELGEAFLRKRKRVKDVKVRPRSIVGPTTGISEKEEVEVEVEIGKLDDLADCVLQGMAWVQWEGNRRKIVEEGESALNQLS